MFSLFFSKGSKRWPWWIWPTRQSRCRS